MQKKLFFIFFLNWEKSRSPDTAKSTFQNPKISSLIGRTWKYSLGATQKIPVLNLWMNWDNLCPKFTVENKIDNLK